MDISAVATVEEKLQHLRIAVVIPVRRKYMDIPNKFSCFIIGEGTLPIQCAEILLDRQHTLYGIISSDVAVHDLAHSP